MKFSKNATDVANRFFRRDFVHLLREFAWMPQAKHRRVAVALYEEKFRAIYNGPLQPEILDCILVFMRTLRIKWGRAVQAHGELDDLAPVIGAIRLGETCAEKAGLWLAQQVVRAFETKDVEFMKRVKKFSLATLGDSRNYQIWSAIGQLVDSRKYEPSKAMSAEMVARGLDSSVGWRFFPNSKEIRDYVVSQKVSGAQGFGNLPSEKDTGGWSRLWISSGAAAFVELDVGGRPRGS